MGSTSRAERATTPWRHRGNAGNLISGSTAGRDGAGASTGNAILGNSIYSNTNATGSGLGSIGRQRRDRQ